MHLQNALLILNLKIIVINAFVMIIYSHICVQGIISVIISGDHICVQGKVEAPFNENQKGKTDHFILFMNWSITN